MKVLLYTNAFSPAIGGVETYIRSLAEGLSGVAKNTEELSIILVTKTGADPGYDARFPFAVVRRFSAFQLFTLIYDSDIVHIAGPALLPMAFSVLLRKPFVVEQHLYQPICPNGLLLYEPTRKVCPQHFMEGRYVKCFECNQASVGWARSLAMLLLTFPRRWLTSRADVNIAITSHVADRLALPRSQVVYYGIVDPLYSPVLGSHGAGDSPPVCFAYVGRFVSEKGLSLLLEAARLLKQKGYNFGLKLVGDGPLRRELEVSVRNLGLEDRVVFTGFLSGRQLEECMADVGVVVMPSICEETAGLSAIEQMFRGRMVIVSDIGGLGEAVGSAGLRFAPGDVGALASCMTQVLEDPNVISAFGSKARQRALDCFSLNKMVTRHLDIYDQLLGRECPDTSAK